MKPFGTWFGRLALAGGCLAWAGCGGGSVPDPDSDANAASEASARPVDRGAAQAPAAEAPAPEAPAPAEPGARARPEPPAVAGNPTAAETERPAPSTAAVAPAESEKATPAVKGDASGTEEMFRIAATPAPTPPPTETPGAAGTPPGGPGGRGSEREGSSSGLSSPPGQAQAMPGGPGAPVGPGGSGSPGEPGGRENFRPESYRPPGVATVPGEPGGPAMRGGPGGSGGPADFTGIGGPGGMNNPNDSAPVGPETFKHPATAVQAFLSALQSKNKDRLTQATARRAQTEAEEKHRKIFAEIIDGSISDDELDEMSKAMTGYRVVNVLPAKSTGRIGVLIAKAEGRDMMQRTITVRKEADGWKVMDISAMLDFKPGLPPIFMRGYRGRRGR
jgi:hypothetical protein